MLHFRKLVDASTRGFRNLTLFAISMLLVTSVFLVAEQHAFAVRLQNRSIYINSSIPGATTFYTITFNYTTPSAIGSVKMLFCEEAIPYLGCTPPVGLDVSNAALSTQVGETGFTMSTHTANEIILSRPPVMTGPAESKYTFTNAVNPTGAPQTFYVQLSTYTSTDASGSLVDYGSVASSTAQIVGLTTQVPPILIFCTAKEIPSDCSDLSAPNEVTLDDLTPDEPQYTSSQMFAYTNARNGYSVVVMGRTMTSGIYEIEPMTSPSVSVPGTSQFGINLTANTDPLVGANPVGPGSNITLNSDYTQPDQYLFRDGDIVATSDGVTLDKKFTVSYLVNMSPEQHPGIYNTTITFICTGAF